MFNLCNDVLNKERRNLFPKIQTIHNKLSLCSLIFLYKQNPLKFYKSFYDKISKASNKTFYNTRMPTKNNSSLSLMSNTHNYFYSVPIKYNYKPEKIITKYSRDHTNQSISNILSLKKENSIKNKSNINQNNFLNNKNLKIIHEYLVKDNENTQNIKNKIKKNFSCKDIYMEDRKDESQSDNSIINDKISRGQQTNFNGQKNYQNEIKKEIEKNNYFKEGKKQNNSTEKKKYIIKKEEKKKKFTIKFEKKKNKFYYKKKIIVVLIK